LNAVIMGLRLGQLVVVAHDASGPPAINWALQHPNHIAVLVLLNTYYCAMPTLRPPEAIFLFSTPIVRNIARRVSAMFNHSIFRRMYWWKVGRFFRDAGVRNQFVPLLYRQFDAAPVGAVRAGTITAPKLKEFKRPVRIIFGAIHTSIEVWHKSFINCFRTLISSSCVLLATLCRWMSLKK